MSEPAAESAPTPPVGKLPYKLVGTGIETNHFDATLNRVVTGYEYQVQWLSNGTVFTVFLPQGSDYAQELDDQARAEGAKLDTLHALAG